MMTTGESSRHNDDSNIQLVNLCITTFKRDHGLTQLLNSISQMQIPNGIRLGLVVVDNFGKGGAEAVCNSWCQQTIDQQLKYIVEPLPGVTNARNRALREIADEAEFVGFLDDDEIVDKRWLIEMLAGLDKFSAAVGNGPVEPVFSENAPKWIVRGGFMHRKRWPSGHIRSTANCGNVLFRRAILLEMDTWFDKAFGLSGGEDTDFFRRVHEQGFRIVWIDEAEVHEPVEASRQTVAWVVRRCFQNANNGFRIRLKYDSSFRSRFIIAKNSFLQIVKAFAFSPLLLLAPFRLDWAVRVLNCGASGIAGIYSLAGGARKNYGDVSRVGKGD